jgi:heme A synthase
MSLLLIHSRLANTGMLYSAAVGLWALYLAFRKRDLDPNFWGALAINEIIFIVEALLGVTMWAQGLRPDRVVHLLYGVLAVITIPAAFAFTRGKGTRREAAIYGLICLFLAGVAIRAATTAA